jgi:protein involved in polysaccharide export with SLBB domain
MSRYRQHCNGVGLHYSRFRAMQSRRPLVHQALSTRRFSKSESNPRSRANVFSRRRPRRGITLGVGDVVSVTIFEAEARGLFVPSEAGARPGNFVTLPEQIVDSNGNITED